MQSLRLEVQGPEKRIDAVYPHEHLVSLMPAFVFGKQVSQGGTPHVNITIRSWIRGRCGEVAVLLKFALALKYQGPQSKRLVSVLVQLKKMEHSSILA